MFCGANHCWLELPAIIKALSTEAAEEKAQQQPHCPYQGQQGSCQSTDGDSLGQITTFWSGISTTESAILTQLNSGPVALALAVDMSTWNTYAGGVLDTCGSAVNHGILVVGYGTDSDSGQDYFKIKNSWGSDWGENGYLRLLRNGKGFCSILSQAYRPTA